MNTAVVFVAMNILFPITLILSHYEYIIHIK